MGNIINELKERQYIITNSDLDGILSASILCKHFPNLKLGGFTNSFDKVWINSEVKQNNSIYLDIYMTNPNVLSIDNHIIDFNSEREYSSLKYNPNIIHKKSLKTYHQKYPFSTFLYIVNILEINGYTLNIDLNKVIGKTNNNENVYVWEVLLRADDTLSNTFLYETNTKYWWKWILSNTNENSLLKQLYNILIYNVKNLDNAKIIKDKVQRFLTEKFGIFSDGYKYIDNETFRDFVSNISECISKPINFDDNFNIINLEIVRLKIDNTVTNFIELNKQYNIKTLAFVKKNLLSFSYIK